MDKRPQRSLKEKEYIMNREEIVAELFRMQDKEYALMQARIIPTVSAGRIIGVRTPALRTFAKRLYRDTDVEAFLACAPHQYFDEDQLHAFVISLEKDFDKCIAEVDAFLPCIDNWATCDQLSPKAFRKEPEKLLPYIRSWINADKTYTIRFAIGMLMQHFLDERFDPKYADMVAEVRSEEYYVNMMIAWYFATALAKQYETILPYLEEKRLADWTHNKAIQKSVESYRITDEQKAYLKTLKVRK
jgi:3-methyladenine DNA glycosylase AlkD